MNYSLSAPKIWKTKQIPGFNITHVFCYLCIFCFWNVGVYSCIYSITTERISFQGSITWMFTDSAVFSIKFRLPSFWVNSTDITFSSDSNSVHLLVEERPIYHLAVPVTGSGNELLPFTVLVWFPAMAILGFKPLYLAFGLLMSMRTASYATQVDPEGVQIVILAPRYQLIYLFY